MEMDDFLFTRLPYTIYGYADAVMLCGREFPEGTRHKDGKGNLPIHCAASSRSNRNVLEALISLDPESVKAEDGAGNLPLHIAAQNNCINTIEKCQKFC